MLAHMERTDSNGKPHEFQLIIVRGKARAGKPKGSMSKVKRVRKLGHASGHNHKEMGTIPLYDVVRQRNMTPFIDNIIYYNGLRVMH